MMMSDILELAIIAFILLGIGFLVWRGGARNPIGTAALGKELAHVGSEMASVKVKVGEIEGRVQKIEEKAVSAADIRQLEKQIAKISAAMPDMESRQRALVEKIGLHAERSAATASKVDHINRQVDLIYQALVTKGMEK